MQGLNICNINTKNLIWYNKTIKFDLKYNNIKKTIQFTISIKFYLKKILNQFLEIFLFNEKAWALF